MKIQRGIVLNQKSVLIEASLDNPIKVTLENRAWRGLRCYTPNFKFKGKEICLEISGGRKEIRVEEYVYDYKEWKWDSGHSSVEKTCHGGILETFHTFNEAVDFIKKKFGIECTYPSWEKELIDQWTWEQNIAYAESDGCTYEPFQLMAKGNDVRVVEIEMLKYIKGHPNARTSEIGKVFHCQEELLTRLMHDYGKPTGTQITGNTNDWKKSKWVITEHGEYTLQQYQKDITEKGYCDRSLY